MSQRKTVSRQVDLQARVTMALGDNWVSVTPGCTDDEYPLLVSPNGVLTLQEPLSSTGSALILETLGQPAVPLKGWDKEVGGKGYSRWSVSVDEGGGDLQFCMLADMVSQAMVALGFVDARKRFVVNPDNEKHFYLVEEAITLITADWSHNDTIERECRRVGIPEK